MTDFTDLLQRYQQRVDAVLLQHLRARLPHQEELLEAMQYGALLGGKRLRPYLVYATGNMLGVPLIALDPIAAAIECIHAYSLIHDDLPAMDNDPLRRGQPTCHIKFGEAQAILAGDALQTLAFSILSSIPSSLLSAEIQVSLIRELANASGMNGMCLGQALDLAAEGENLSLSMLENIHQHKTGALIRASVRLAALAAGEAGEQALPLLEQYANAIGLAFQVQDDILDIVGDTTKTGKLQGSDLVAGKNTYPALLGLEQATNKAQELYQEAQSVLFVLSSQSYETAPLYALARFIIERDR